MSITGTQPVTFTSPSSQAADYRIYGELPAGQIVLSVRTPRTRNLLPYPYSGIETGAGVTIPTVSGANVLDVPTTVPPSDVWIRGRIKEV